jgi:nucleoside 2-deoxyribosyltransferase
MKVYGWQMKVYVATSFTNKDLAKRWMKRLEEYEIEITYDWTGTENPVRGELELPLERQSEIADLDADGVRRADIVWVISPRHGGCGCWFEMGLAVGSGKKVFVSGPRRTIFMAFDEVEYFETHHLAFNKIIGARTI